MSEPLAVGGGSPGNGGGALPDFERLAAELTLLGTDHPSGSGRSSLSGMPTIDCSPVRPLGRGVVVVLVDFGRSLIAACWPVAPFARSPDDDVGGGVLVRFERSPDRGGRSPDTALVDADRSPDAGAALVRFDRSPLASCGPVAPFARSGDPGGGGGVVVGFERSAVGGVVVGFERSAVGGVVVGFERSAVGGVVVGFERSAVGGCTATGCCPVWPLGRTIGFAPVGSRGTVGSSRSRSALVATIFSSSALRSGEPGGGGGFVFAFLRGAGAAITPDESVIARAAPDGAGVPSAVGVPDELDAGPDARPDAGPDAAPETGPEAGPDADGWTGSGAESGSFPSEPTDQPEARSAIRDLVSSPSRRRFRSSSGTGPTIT